MSRTKWVIAVVAAAVIAVVGGTWVYLNVLRDDAPERVTLESRDDATSTSDGDDRPSDGGSIEGAWVVADGSQVGYRVTEVLFGQDAEAVGTTDDVTGELVIEGTTATSAGFEVDLTTVTSDEDRRDGQFRDRLMEVDQYPTAVFTLTEPLDFGAVPADGEIVELTAVGDLTLKDVTAEIELPIRARLSGSTIEVEGLFEVVFADWGIENPSNVAASVGDRGDLEIFLVLSKT